MSDATLNGLRQTSSFMKNFDSKPDSLPINQSILQAVRNSRSNYHRRMQAQKELERTTKNTIVIASAKRKYTEEKEERLKQSEELRKEGENHA